MAQVRRALAYCGRAFCQALLCVLKPCGESSLGGRLQMTLQS